MSDGPPRRPRRASLDVALIVIAMLFTCWVPAAATTYRAGARWVQELVTTVGVKLHFYGPPFAAVLLLGAALVIRCRARRAARHEAARETPGTPRSRPRRSWTDVVLIAAAMLLTGAFAAINALDHAHVSWATNLILATGRWSWFYVPGVSVLLLVAALVVRPRTG